MISAVSEGGFILNIPMHGIGFIRTQQLSTFYSLLAFNP